MSGPCGRAAATREAGVGVAQVPMAHFARAVAFFERILFFMPLSDVALGGGTSSAPVGGHGPGSCCQI